MKKVRIFEASFLITFKDNQIFEFKTIRWVVFFEEERTTGRGNHTQKSVNCSFIIVNW